MADCPDDNCWMCTGSLVCLDCGEDLRSNNEDDDD